MTSESNGDLKSDITEVKRLPERGSYDRDVVYAILDEGYVCHVGFIEDGQPLVIPTLYARIGDDLILHGSAASRTLRTAAQGADLCVTVTLVDGLVLARSGFHHSVNYRSVVIVGRAHLIEEPTAQEAALDALVEHVVPGRIEGLRPMTDKERKATKVLRMPITSASAKVRQGPPVDEPEDYDWPVWAGVLPVTTSYGPAVVDAAMTMDVPVPDHVSEYQRRKNGNGR